MLQWLRRNFVAGLFVTIPVVVTVVALIWVVQLADALTARLTGPLGETLIGRYAPGLGIAITVVLVLAVGIFATNVMGRRLVNRIETLLMHVPVFRTVYGPVKQIIAAFSPDNEVGFKKVVLVHDDARGMVLGFLTREFTVRRAGAPETMMAVFVPTNHLYLGDIVICTPDRVTFPDLTVEEGLRVFLTGGVGLPDDVQVKGSAE